MSIYSAEVRRTVGICSHIPKSQSRESSRVLHLKALWTSLFRCVRGDEVYLLTPESTTSFASNEPTGKKWLVTKPGQMSGCTVVWSIAFEAADGTQVQVEINEHNAMELLELARA